MSVKSNVGKLLAVSFMFVLLSTFIITAGNGRVSAGIKVLYDDLGVPYVDYGTTIGIQRNPYMVGLVAIDYYWADFMKGDLEAKQYFLNCARWLVNNLVLKDGYGVYEYEFDWSHYSMKAPWISGMAQSQSLQVLSRAESITGDQEYLDAAETVLDSFYIEEKDGGVTQKTPDKGWWYEEYASETGDHPRVLNGMIITVLGLHDYYEQTGSLEAKALFDLGLTAVRENLPSYDGNRCSYYDCLGYVADSKYHDLHISLLETLYDKTGDELFSSYAKKWKSYTMVIKTIQPSSGVAGTEVAIKGKCFGNSRGSSVVKFGDTAACEYTYWSDTFIKVKAPPGVVSSDVTVITGLGVTNGAAFTAFPTYYLAEGSTAHGFDCYVTIENPNSSKVSADVIYLTSRGRVPGDTVILPPESQTTIHPEEVLGEIDFSTLVACKEDKMLTVDRTMSWKGEAALSPEGHNSIGVAAPANTWYLPEGSSAWGFECYLLIQNPNDTDAACRVIYMTEGAGPMVFERKVPGNSRATFSMKDDIGEQNASITVISGKPVISERAMYRDNRREGHDSIGATIPRKEYYLAEGTTDYGFTTYVLIQNPNNAETTVNLTYMTNSGPVQHPENPILMPANSRKTVRVNDYLRNRDFSTHISGSRPVVCERAMYWGEGTQLGEACHDSIGLAAPHGTFYLPDGRAGGGYETYTLVQNPNDNPVEVEVSYLTATGEDNVAFTEIIGANSRETYVMSDRISGMRAATVVRSRTTGAGIIVERSMYWNNMGTGTNTIGAYSD